ncbi:MAG: ribosomal L7Ae/L30e/S12e/Gadd45 family protein [Syntrophomonadaceae bacterium]|nr:ribosomal L7Ae/L30e/S12e/Gadd45 family protein [Syntrophomonadaceae bacterium]
MILDKLKGQTRVIGTKQVKKAITKGEAVSILLANDAEPHIIEPIKELCREHNVEYEMVDTMEQLGKACGIDVGAATVALINFE